MSAVTLLESKLLGSSGHKVAWCLALCAASALWSARGSSAQGVEQIAENPPSAEIMRGAPAEAVRSLTVSPEAAPIASTAGEASWSANIDYTNAQIFNPRSGKYDKVRLRSYQGAGVDPDFPFVAPTISLFPGETFRITLNNRLPAHDPSCTQQSDPNIPHCFNSTNLHAHGLWVSPLGNSDNVLLCIKPGVEFQYEYNIPADHPAGTYWYHPHLHGSTALQVSSGMAGALIVKGTRLPAVGHPGDIDTLLRKRDGASFPERIVLLQQIPYACRNGAGRIKTDPPGDENGLWVCDAADVGEIERYSGPVRPDQFGPPSWRRSGRYTTINGRTVPTFEGATAGQVERWRLIHAGVRDTILLSFQKLVPTQIAMASAVAYTAATADARAAFVEQNCSGDDIPHHTFAADGLTRDRFVEQKRSILQPGYREDILMVFPEPGVYCIVDGFAPPESTVNEQSKSRQLLGFVSVGPGPGTNGLGTEAYLKQELMAAAESFMPVEMRQSVVADLDQRLGLKAFEPHGPIQPQEVTGTQTVSFSIDQVGSRLAFQIGSLDDAGQAKALKSYDPKRIDRKLRLNGVDEWTLKSFVANHPFHIHVNPFQIVEILESGRDVSGFEPDNTSPYARLKGVWKDTLFIAGANRTFVLRSRYRRYIGDFVLHCHILDHEDQGMMQNVSIMLPDGQGGLVEAHH